MCAQNCVLLRRRRRRRRRLSVCRRRRQVETCVGSERVHECTDAFGFTISWIAASAAWMSTNEWMRESNALYNLMRWWLVIILFVPSPVSDAGDKHESYKCVHVLFLQLAFWHLWYILINVSGRSVSGVSFRGECSDSQTGIRYSLQFLVGMEAAVGPQNHDEMQFDGSVRAVTIRIYKKYYIASGHITYLYYSVQ